MSQPVSKFMENMDASARTCFELGFRKGEDRKMNLQEAMAWFETVLHPAPSEPIGKAQAQRDAGLRVTPSKSDCEETR